MKSAAWRETSKAILVQIAEKASDTFATITTIQRIFAQPALAWMPMLLPVKAQKFLTISRSLQW